MKYIESQKLKESSRLQLLGCPSDLDYWLCAFSTKPVLHIAAAFFCLACWPVLVWLMCWRGKCISLVSVLVWLGKPPRNCLQVQRGIARKGGGVSTLARMVWGTLSAPNQMGNMLD